MTSRGIFLILITNSIFENEFIKFGEKILKKD
jgi:hypothetical protein